MFLKGHTFEKLYAKKLYNLEEMDNFLEKYNLQRKKQKSEETNYQQGN